MPKRTDPRHTSFGGRPLNGERPIRFRGKRTGLMARGCDRLESDFSSELPEPGQMRCRGFPEISIRVDAVWVVEIDVQQIGPIENIEELKPEFEIDSLGNAGLLVKVDIGLGKVRCAEPANLFISLCPERRNREVARGNGPGKKGSARRGLSISDRIRIVVIVPICVVVSALGSVANRRVGGRRASSGVGAYGLIIVGVSDGQGRTGLENARAADAPSAGQMADDTGAAIQSS